MYKIIGQSNNKELIERLINENKMPHFICIEGVRFSGKTLMSRYISYLLKCPYVEISNIEDIREMRDESINTTFDKTFIVSDFNSLNFRASEAMLKIMEEPPKGSYIIINTSNSSTIKNTIINRSFILKMENYCISDLKEYVKKKSPKELSVFENNNLFNIFNTIGSLDYILKDGRLDFYLDFLFKFVRSINKVNGGNAIKSVNYIDVKREGIIDKIDIEIFFMGVYSLLLDYMKDGGVILTSLLNLINENLRTLRSVGTINIENLYLNFIIEYRKRSKELGFTGLQK